jgi:hypothetical protein
MDFKSENFMVQSDDDEWITRCVVNTMRRRISLYSNEGDERHVDCESVDQVMGVLEVVSAFIPEKVLVYADLVSSGE